MPERRTSSAGRSAGRRGRDTTERRPDSAEDAYEDEEYQDESYEDDDNQDVDYDDEAYDEVEEDTEVAPRRTRETTKTTKTMSVTDAARAGLRQIVDMTGKEASAVVFVEPREEGWVVGVEVVEDRRVPSTSDMLGLYEVTVDTDGNLASYRRTRRYARGRADDRGDR